MLFKGQTILPLILVWHQRYYLPMLLVLHYPLAIAEGELFAS